MPSRNVAPPPEDGYEAALRAADALFSARPEPQRMAESPSMQQDMSEGAPTPPHPSGGRILRAIDEPPPAELLRLEAELAPKRRGRKPGSKNKPKLPASVVKAALEATPEPVDGEPRAFSSVLAMPVRSAAAVGVPGASKGKHYAWVRTKLKPGQHWKRRLPKVAW